MMGMLPWPRRFCRVVGRKVGAHLGLLLMGRDSTVNILLLVTEGAG
jgi:hypothetical protein